MGRFFIFQKQKNRNIKKKKFAQNAKNSIFEGNGNGYGLRCVLGWFRFNEIPDLSWLGPKIGALVESPRGTRGIAVLNSDADEYTSVCSDRNKYEICYSRRCDFNLVIVRGGFYASFLVKVKLSNSSTVQTYEQTSGESLLMNINIFHHFL